MKMKVIKAKVTYTEEMLGTSSSNPEIHEEFIASKAPDAASTEEEVAALGVEAVVHKGMTIFPRDEGQPFVWNYQVKGFLKEACRTMARVPGSKTSKLKAYIKLIDGLVFVFPRKILFKAPDGGRVQVGNCQRPILCQTAQGPRVALANSETVPTGSAVDFEIHTLDPKLADYIREWMDYGLLRGMGCWRNSGKGSFQWEDLSEAKAE